ncbi:MAG TPA: arylsulfotransferase family protein [Solirubrobacteraceae bacterium]|jgi:hypothetical protein|nr:arylsulfotransferase family protein [Solirubrobacteraceae bacterium]
MLAPLCACAVACASAPAARASGVIISPLPGSAEAMPSTQISFLGARAGSLSHVVVLGSVTGAHRGHLRPYASATGASFIPHRAFAAGERVNVHALWTPAAGRRVRLSTSFTVARPASVPLAEFPATPGTAADVQGFASAPALHPPAVTVHQAATAAGARGDLFATPFLGPGQWGPMIFTGEGQLVWFHPLPAGQDAADLRTQDYLGRNDLTWWQGRTITLGYGLGEDVIADANYRTVAVVHAGNGLRADEHEFTITPSGAAFITAYSPVQESLAPVGGASSGIAVDCAVQEVDVRTGLVMWEWHSLGHVPITESYSKPPASPTGAYDYFHVNSVASDSHGNLLVSGRNTSAIYEIDHHTGAVTWRLGGKRSSFALGPGVAFAYQHDATWFAPDEVALFDDEGAPAVAPPSRGEVVRLDAAKRTATLATSLVRSGGALTTSSQGDLQALPGGGWMIGWGGLPNFTEFDASGTRIYDAQLPAGENSYRVYRLPWAGQPTEPPALAVIGGIAYASWNGATTVASWQLLSGPSADHLLAGATVPASGFETAMPAPPGAVYAVRALSAAGHVLATSKATGPSA